MSFKYILLFPVLFTACTPVPDGKTDFDPYESQNRKVHEFNKSLDNTIFGGVGDVAKPIDPELVQPVVNFADNVGLPGMVINGLLQADVAGAATNTVRFILNTTVGIGGLFDPAGAIGLAEEETDFGETLAIWGVPEGAYLELPVLGPHTERALAGRVVDSIIDPLDQYGTNDQIKYGTSARIIGRIIKRSQLDNTINSVLSDSEDSYTQLRLIYLQNRRFELGTTPDEDSFDVYDELYGDQ